MIPLKKELKARRKAKKTKTDTTTVHDCAPKNDTNSLFITNLFPKMLLFLWCTHPSPSPEYHVENLYGCLTSAKN